MAKFDEVIHQSARLRIVSALSSLGDGERMNFSLLRDLLNLTDGNLGAHLLKLEEAGYVRVQKEIVGKKPAAFLSLTHRGRAAFEEHLAALREILPG